MSEDQEKVFVADIGCPVTQNERERILNVLFDEFPDYYRPVIAKSLNSGVFLANCEVDDDTQVDEYDVNIVISNLEELSEYLVLPDDGMALCAYIGDDGFVLASTEDEDLDVCLRLIFGVTMDKDKRKYAFIDEGVFSVEEAVDDVKEPSDEMLVACFQFLTKRGKG